MRTLLYAEMTISDYKEIYRQAESTNSPIRFVKFRCNHSAKHHHLKTIYWLDGCTATIKEGCQRRVDDGYNYNYE